MDGDAWMVCMQVWSKPHVYVRAKDGFADEAFKLLRLGVAVVQDLSLDYYVCPSA